MKIRFIRHGATLGNLRKEYIGSTDEGLSEEGKKNLFPSPFCPEKIYVSPKLRCRETAEIMFPTIPQEVVLGLEEMDFGVFEGKNFADLRDDKDYQHWIQGQCEGICPFGEGKQDFILRCVTTFERVVTNTQEDCFFVVHGGTIMAICSYFVQNSSYFQWQVPCGASLEFLWNGKSLEFVS